MKVTRREILKGAAIAGAAAALPGGLAGPAAAQTTQKRELVVAQGGDIAFLDPHMSTSSNDIRISFNIFDNLTSRRPDGKLSPGLATEWKLQGQQAWVFKLRQGVKWHNGDPFSSADAKFSIERTYDPAAKTRVNTVLTTIERIEAPDPTTVVIHTKKPDPLLPARLGFYAGQIVPKKYLESVGAETFNQKPVGTGPVRFVSWTKDDRIVLDANADYWGGKPDFDRLVVRALPEMAPRVAALLKGEVDIVTQLPPDQGERVKGNASTRGGGRPLRRPLRPRREQQGQAARQPAGQAGAVAGHRPRVDHQGAVARPRRRAERAHRQGRQPLRRLAAGARLRPEGGEGAAEEGRVQGRGDHHRDHRRLHGRRQAHGRGGAGHVEGRRDQRQGRGRRVLGARAEEPGQDASRGSGGPIPPPPSAIPTA